MLTLPEAAAYLRLPVDAILSEVGAGRLRGRRYGDDWRFVRKDLIRWVRVTPAFHPSPAPPDPLPDGPAGAKWVREKEAFRALLPGLLRTHPGQYVAIHDGSVVAAGDDKIAVALKAYESHGYQPMFVGLVTDAPPRVVYIGGTPVGTPEME